MVKFSVAKFSVVTLRQRVMLCGAVCCISGALWAEGVTSSAVDKRLFLSSDTLAQLDGMGQKSPIVLPDLDALSTRWLHYYGSVQSGKQSSVLVNEIWISQPTKIHGIMIVPSKVTALGALPIMYAGESVWLAPGQAMRVD